MVNRAIWIGEDGRPSIRNVDEEYEPLDTEVLVEVLYSGINPADILHGLLGFKNCVAGYDFAGTVLKCGPARKDLSPGDQVLGFADPLLNKPNQYGVHKRYHCARHFVYPVPPSMPMTDASCLMVVTHTAADALFNQLQVPFEQSGIPILIWGAASAVGSAAVQFAKMAGCYPILATASAKNHAALSALGATECFDYHDSEIVKKIQASLKQHTSKPLLHVLDAVVSRGQPSSTALCEEIADEGSRFTSSIPVAEGTAQKWEMAFACRNVDVDLTLPNGLVRKNPAVPEWQANIDKATKWAIDNYGSGYCMPNVVVVSGGEEGMEAMILVEQGRASMQKYVIEHPI